MLQVAREGFEAFREQQIGWERPVSWESKRRGQDHPVWTGLTANDIRVHTESRQDLGNLIAPAQLLELEGDSVSVRLVEGWAFAKLQ